MTAILPKENGNGEDLLLKSIFQQEVSKRGILFNGSLFTSWSHTDSDIAQTLDAFNDALQVLKVAIESGHAEDFLEGEVVSPVFRRL